MPSSNADLAERISALAGPVVEGLEAELVDVEVKGQKGSRVVRVVADADEGLDLDLIADLSRQLGDALDADDELVDGQYTLEVSSPGVDRKLTDRRHFERNVGRDLRIVRTKAAIDAGAKGELTGRLHELEGETLKLRVEKGRELSVPLADVDHARVVLPW